MTDMFETEQTEAPAKRKRGASGPRQKPQYAVFGNFVDANGNVVTGVDFQVIAVVNKANGKDLYKVISEIGAANFATVKVIDVTV